MWLLFGERSEWCLPKPAKKKRNRATIGVIFRELGSLSALLFGATAVVKLAAEAARNGATHTPAPLINSAKSARFCLNRRDMRVGIVPARLSTSRRLYYR